MSDAVYYILLPAVHKAHLFAILCWVCLTSSQAYVFAFAVLKRAAGRMSFPFAASVLRKASLVELDDLLDDKIFIIFVVLHLLVLMLTMVQIYFWPHSTRYLWLNAGLCCMYAVSIEGFRRGWWRRETGARIFCISHLVFMCVGASVSGGPVAKVLFDQYAFAAIFSLFALVSSLEFAYFLMMVMSVFVWACEIGLFQPSSDPWFHLASMQKDSTYLPVVVASVVLVHAGARRLVAVFKGRRLIDYFSEASKQKDLFLRNVTHEIKSPLNGIINCAELLQANISKFSEDDAASISVILHSSSVLNLLVNNVLSRDALLSEESVVWEETELRPFFAGVCKVLTHLVYKSDIAFGVTVADEVPKYAVVPRSMLTQILLNLGLNAIKHAGSGKEVNVLVESDGEKLVCQICDRGPGIANEAELFSPDRKRGPTTGTGLGLQVCQSLCALIRGSLLYKPNGHKGSVFYVELVPKDRNAVPPELQRKFSQPLASAATRSSVQVEAFDEDEALAPPLPDFLIVDDSPANVLVMQRLLCKRLGVAESRCSVARDGLEALKHCEAWCRAGAKKPLIVFLDIQMPGMDGSACARHWRYLEQMHGVPVPAFIAAVSAGEVRGTDFDESVEKPIQLAHVSGILTTATRKLRGDS